MNLRIDMMNMPHGDFFMTSFIGLIVLLIMFMAFIYILLCRQYHKKIRRLDNSGEAYCGYRLQRLRKVLIDLEYERISANLTEL